MYRRLVPLSRMLHNGVGVEGRRAGRKAGIYGHANAQRRQVSRCSVYPRHAWGVLRMYGTKQFGASVRPQPLLQPHSVAAARHVVRHGGQQAEGGVDGPRCGGLAGEGWRRLRCIGHTSRAPTRCCTYMPCIARLRTSERIREGCQGEEECRWWWCGPSCQNSACAYRLYIHVCAACAANGSRLAS